MKRKILGLIMTIIAVFAIGTSAYAAIYVNNEDVSNEVFTTISNDYTLFPVRYLGEKLGCDVYWNPDDKCITVSKGDIHRDFYNGSSVVYDWNGNSYNLVTAPMLVDGNTMVPSEFYCDHFGISVLWDSVTSSLFINSEDTYNWLINTPEYKYGSINDGYLLNVGIGNDESIAVCKPVGSLRNLEYTYDELKRIFNIPNAEVVSLDGSDEVYCIIPKYKNSNVTVRRSDFDFNIGGYVDGDVVYSGSNPIILVCNHSNADLFTNSKVTIECIEGTTEFRPQMSLQY